MAARGEKLAQLTDRMLRTSKRPEVAFVRIPYLFPDPAQCTDLEPAKSLYRMTAQMEERPGVWTASLMAGFYQGDVPFAGPSLFVYADDQATADAAASELEEAILEAEPSFSGRLLSVEEAVERAAAWEGAAPLILADIQDNPGGGAASDNIELLEALAARGVPDAAVAMVCDPDAARTAHEAGVGARVKLALGGKGTDGQTPLVGEFTVVATNRHPIALEGPFSGLSIDIGQSAALRFGGVHVVVSSKPSQCLDRAYFRAHGIEPERQRVLVVKSAAHYRADFEPMAGGILDVATNSGCVADATKLPFRKLREDVRLSGMGPTLADLRRSKDR
jgi:microcystin degradation protein MlrC